MTCELSLPYSKVKRERGAASGGEGQAVPSLSPRCGLPPLSLSPAVTAPHRGHLSLPLVSTLVWLRATPSIAHVHTQSC